MSDLLTQFELLLDAGKLEEAKAMLERLLLDEPTAEDRAKAKVLQARLAIKLENAVNQAYLDTLNDSIEKLKLLDAKHKELVEKAKLAKARAALAGQLS